MVQFRRWHAFLAAGLVAVGLAGCQTTKHGGEPYPRAASNIVFIPVARDVSIQAGEGRYPNLYTGASHAIWDPDTAPAPMAEPAVTPAVASKATGGPAKDTDAATDKSGANTGTAMEGARTMPQARHGGLKISCYLESEFSDMSIAYDAVGLRGVDIYLQVPGGGEIPPSQKVVDPNVSETPVGALRRYGRKLTLYFPKRFFKVENPAANPAAQGVRLVLEAHNTTFYFEWQATPDFLAQTGPRIDYKAREKAKQGYNSSEKAVKRFMHNFD